MKPRTVAGLPGRDRTKHCCTCGEPRRPTQKPVESFNNGSQIIHMRKHREMKDGRWEDSPQLIASVSVYRNGGTDYGNTHICDGCIVVALRALKLFIDESLSMLDPAERHVGDTGQGWDREIG